MHGMARLSTHLIHFHTLLLASSPTVPSEAPTDVVGVALDPRTLRLSWSPVPEEERNGVILQYGVSLREQEGGVGTIFTTGRAVPSHHVPNLHPHYHYQFNVTAFTSKGHGPYSQPGSIQMPPDGEPLYTKSCSHHNAPPTITIPLHP